MNMRNFICALTSVVSLAACSTAWADETIYTWQDQADLTNYAAVPPDDQIGSDNLKVFHPEKGLVTQAGLPARDPLVLNDGKTPPPVHSSASTPSGSSQPATTVPSGAVISQTPGATPSSTGTNKAEPAAAPDAAKNPATNTRVLTQGSNQQTVYPVDDPDQKRKISEQVDKIEANAKTAKRVAEERRMDEMKDLAERVRNGAATKKEIAALMMYRQTASFRDARKAMAAPVKTVQSFE